MTVKSNPSDQTRIPIHQKFLFRFLELFFHYLYNEMAWSYDLVSSAVSLGRWRLWTEASITYLFGQQILEIGHGPGHLITKLLQCGKQAFGIDISPHMGRLTSAKLKQDELPLNITTAESQCIPFSTEEFDHVLATFPTNYILDEKTLREIYRVLKPTGSLVVVPIAWITGDSIFDRAASWLFRITGQSPQWDDRVLEPAIEAGFNVNVDRISLENSEVLIVTAEKNKAV